MRGGGGFIVTRQQGADTMNLSLDCINGNLFFYFDFFNVNISLDTDKRFLTMVTKIHPREQRLRFLLI